MGDWFSEWARTRAHNWFTHMTGMAVVVGVGSALLTGYVLTGVWRKVFWTPLEKAYWGQYQHASGIRGYSGFGAAPKSEYRFFFVKRRGAKEPLKPGDAHPAGRDEVGWENGKLVVIGSVAENWEPFTMSATRNDREAAEWMRTNVYGGRSVFALLMGPWYAGGSVWAAVMGAVAYLNHRERRRAKAKKVLRGTQLISAREFRKRIRGEGIGIPHLEGRRMTYVPIRERDETEHVQVIGDTRQGKSVLLHHFLHQLVVRPEHRVAVYDPALEFWECHSVAERGDVLLHPLSADCPFWDVADEIRTPADATQLAKSFLPDRDEGRKDFWDMAPQRLLAFLLVQMRQRQLGIPDLLRWMENAEEIDTLVSGTDLAPLIEKNAASQRAGVFASMNSIADALRLLPPNDGRPKFSFRKWAETKKGWIFIASRPNEREALKPLISAWLDTLFGRLMTAQGGPPTWCFIDELPSLQKLPKLKDALQEAGKYNLRFVVGFHGRAQLEQLYGRVAETLMSAPGCRVFLKTKEFSAARWIAENIGMAEQEREVEGLTAGRGGGRDALTYHTERKTDYLVLPNEIQNLDKLTGYLRYDRYVVPIRFQPLDFSTKNTFRERAIQLGSLPEPQVVNSEAKPEVKPDVKPEVKSESRKKLKDKEPPSPLTLPRSPEAKIKKPWKVEY